MREHQNTKPSGNPLKNRGLTRVMPLPEIIDIVDRTKMGEARKAVNLLDSQIEARRIDLMSFDLENVIAAENCLRLNTDVKNLKKAKKNPKLGEELEHITRIMQEIAVLESKKEKIKSADAFVETFRTD